MNIGSIFCVTMWKYLRIQIESYDLPYDQFIDVAFRDLIIDKIRYNGIDN